MHDLLVNLFSSSSFIPHGHCYLWKPSLVWLHVISDAIITLSYYSIPLTLFYFVRKRQDLPFSWIFLLFATFIVSCGTTHLAEIWTLWHPTYWLSGVLKVGTAGVSFLTAMELIPLVPKALALPSPAELRQVNAALSTQVEERLRAEAELKQLQDQLEQRVKERTAELVHVNQQLQQEIEERQRVEIALRTSQERLVLAQQVGKMGTCEWNIKTGELIWTEEMEVLFGLAPGSFEGSYEYWLNRIHPDDRPAADQAAQRTAIAGADFDTEFRLVRPTGEVRWVTARAQVFYDDADKPDRLIGVNMDVTDRKHAEQALQQHSTRLNLLYETTSELLSAPQPLELMNQLFKRLSAQMDLHFYYHFQLVTQDGKQLLQLMNYQGISAEQAQAFASIDLGQAMCGLVAQERRQIVLNQVEIATHPKAQAICMMGVSAYAGQPLMVHGQLLGVLSFASRTRPEFTLEEVELLQVISKQVAIALDRAELVASLQQQTEDLVQANRIKDEFLAVLSHELRSPLNPILGWAKLLQTGKFDAQRTKQALEIIERNAKQQTQLIDDLLDISKILRGKLMLSEAPVNLVLTIESALETVRLAAEAKSIQIKTDFDLSLSPVLGDAGRLQQIVLNLLSNAIKFTPIGGLVTVRLARIASETIGKGTNEPVHHYAQITISDTGKGIAPDFLPFVFDSFRQEDGKTTRKFGGLGLGLAIVRQLTELHGGTVQAESQGEGTGATFTIRLPLMTTRLSLGSLQPSTPASNSEFVLQGISVLVVDDEADMRTLVAMILEQAGAIVQTAPSAIVALSLLEQFQPRVLISDIGMPDMDGYELIQRVRGRTAVAAQPMLAIALTAYAMEQDQQQALTAGYQRHLAKPIEPDRLIQAIATLIKQEELGENVSPL
ncbi:ATP-binding protein [Pantanalinema rosaneae CENA516]|uniref:ATP-binding protein n=1 Tax=Pantanalinema rosaneae TaxID=1620701 RepID=UPI003D6F57E2